MKNGTAKKIIKLILDFRVKDGLMDFLNPRLDGDFKVTYFSEE